MGTWPFRPTRIRIGLNTPGRVDTPQEGCGNWDPTRPPRRGQVIRPVPGYPINPPMIIPSTCWLCACMRKCIRIVRAGEWKHSECAVQVLLVRLLDGIHRHAASGMADARIWEQLCAGCRTTTRTRKKRKKKRHHTLCSPRAACLGWQTHQDEPTGFSADRRIL